MTRSFMTLVTAATILAASCSKDDNKLQHYELSKENSFATWKGYLRTGYFNEGTIAIEGPAISLENGVVTGGSFTMPLSSLKNLNLPDEQKPVLITHLQSSDFFNMVLYPSLQFSIREVATYSSNDSGAVAGANYQVAGDLTMLGVTQPVHFPARIAVKEKELEIDAEVIIDRTKWGMNYAAADTLSDEHYIKPEVSINLHVRGIKAK